MDSELDTSSIVLNGSTWHVERWNPANLSIAAYYTDLAVIVERDRNSMIMAVRYLRDGMKEDAFLPEEWWTLETVAGHLRGRLIFRRAC